MHSLILLQTARLQLRLLTVADADFILELVNDPAWLEFIGDRNIHDRAAAGAYIGRCRAMHAQHGVASLAVEITATGEVIGICGLLRRDGVAELDLGFAFLERFRGRGYAREAAATVLAFGHQQLRQERILALVHPHNAASIALLLNLGFRFDSARPGKNGTHETRVFAHHDESALVEPAR